MEEEDKPGITQIPLMEDLVYDSSLPLKPPRRPPTKDVQPTRINYSPNYDPDTIDLFEDGKGEPDIQLDDSIAVELRQSADHLIDELVDEYSAEIGRRLRAELTEQLTSILDDLDDPDES